MRSLLKYASVSNGRALHIDRDIIKPLEDTGGGAPRIDP